MRENIADTKGLVDIATVSVEKTKPDKERIADYVRQIRDPYHFMCGAYEFIAIYPKDAPPMSECLRRVVA